MSQLARSTKEKASPTTGRTVIDEGKSDNDDQNYLKRVASR
jgi:hypothetical protein